MSEDISKRLRRCSRIDELLEHHNRERPDQVAVQVRQDFITYSALLRRVERLSAQLADQGLEPEERIAPLSKNDVAFIKLMMAASRIGLVLVLLNFRLVPPEIEFILSDSVARLLFSGPDFADVAKDVLVSCDRLNGVVEITGDGQYGGWLQATESVEAPASSDDAILFQMYTSGTTGKPKGALIS